MPVCPPNVRAGVCVCTAMIFRYSRYCSPYCCPHSNANIPGGNMIRRELPWPALRLSWAWLSWRFSFQRSDFTISRTKVQQQRHKWLKLFDGHIYKVFGSNINSMIIPIVHFHLSCGLYCCTPDRLL